MTRNSSKLQKRLRISSCWKPRLTMTNLRLSSKKTTTMVVIIMTIPTTKETIMTTPTKRKEQRQPG